MNKLIATIALAALAFTSCIKENDTWKEMRPVQPGIIIYNDVVSQNNIASLPAVTAMRMAMLLAESDIQGKDDFLEVTYEKTSLKNRLLGTSPKIEKLDGGDYLFTYTDGMQSPDGYIYSGKLLIQTHGKSRLAETDYSTPWSIQLSDFKVTIGNDDRQTSILFNSGLIYLYGSSGYYTIRLENIDANLEGRSLHSNWNGSFNICPEDISLAYSLCSGKDFKIDGSANGSSFLGIDDDTSADFKYEISDGIFRNFGIIRSGTEDCTLVNYYETNFLDGDVKVEWTLSEDGSKQYQTIHYNGYVWSSK